ncbi:MAG: 3-methyladenine DNA glycosylase [Bdellovibrionales bacterium GWC1_52_8]|nr:MAG: 3-methyladenine DNA glycosylase [Bdellovibrionales bacterium GWB1_52_6]OFZ02489.1 MAG: 3-methyladenine DNA glycosylase [Bdellovibrionales bacterium GWA1_52_35]OFZ35666.1 MAG: 3-methyladenine DNA glycosylase [Bdellovibrionales bacterium GWC1_52_8]
MSGSVSAKAELLGTDFYRRDTLRVAKELLGKILIVRTPAGVTAGRIVETEAYSEKDPASHSFRGHTPRSSVMFGEPGVAYVYFIYGMHEMLNFVTEPRGSAGAVLIRAVEPLYGEELMLRRRKSHSRRDLTSGPGKLASAFGIRMTHNTQKLTGPKLYVYDDGFKPSRVATSPRIGISQAQKKEWRFFIPENIFVSRSVANARSTSRSKRRKSRSRDV